MNTPLVGIIMGSKSDWNTMKAACDVLEEFGGQYTIYPVATSPNCAYKIYPDRIHHPNQYLVVEYRNTQTPFDGTVYGTGAVIYRVNTDYDGNSGADYINQFPEIYAFRKNSSPQGGSAAPSTGNIYQSYFGSYNMKEFSEYTNPYPFYANGTPITGLRLTDFQDFGDSLQFYLVAMATGLPTTKTETSVQKPIT